jgi:hypothetical protein
LKYKDKEGPTAAAIGKVIPGKRSFFREDGSNILGRRTGETLELQYILFSALPCFSKTCQYL